MRSKVIISQYGIYLCLISASTTKMSTSAQCYFTSFWQFPSCASCTEQSRSSSEAISAMRLFSASCARSLPCGMGWEMSSYILCNVTNAAKLSISFEFANKIWMKINTTKVILTTENTESTESLNTNSSNQHEYGWCHTESTESGRQDIL